jgi:acetolactate synthase-1/2/3 large subunit
MAASKSASASTNLATMSAGEITLRTLVANGIDKLYCLPGVQNDDLFDALVQKTPELKPIHTRHEQATAYMALGAAMATGKPQAYCVVPGPGFLNSTAALATAQSLCQPVLAVSGQIFARAIGKGFGYLHEIPNQLSIMKTLTKWAEHIDGAEDAGAKTREAFRQLLSGAPAPVGIECAWDRWKAKAEVAFDDTRVARETPPVDTDAIKAAAKLLGAAKSPLIVVGGGAQDASAEVRQLAEMLQAPVIANRTGKGVLDSRQDLSQCFTGGHRLWKTADVVIGVGTRLQPYQTDWGVDDDLKIIHLDIDPTKVGRIRKPTIGIVADAVEGLQALLAELPKHNTKRGSRADEMKALKAGLAKDFEYFAPQMRWIEAIRKAVPEDGVVVEELTQISYASRLLYDTYQPRTYLATGYQGTLGWGYPTALGVKAALPDRAVISVTGDGGFMFGMQEIATAVRHKLGMVTVLFNDNAYGNVKRMQEMHYQGRVVASDLTNPDFVKLGQSFGIRAERVSDPAGLGKAITAGIKSGEPTLIEVPVGTFPDPWKYTMLPRVRGS